jgi:hypothetical protein
MPQKTTRIEQQTYLVYEAGNLHWKILVRKDSNSNLYVPVYRKGWQDGGEVEIFSLLPPADCGDEPLLHIRIYTKANDADQVPPLPNPPISIQSHLPALTFIEPEKQRVRVQLMCLLSLEGRRLKITPLIEPEDF